MPEVGMRLSHNIKTYHRRSIRLPEYDYTEPGAYFITICAYGRQCVFGEIVGGEMILNKWGEVASGEWIKTEQIRSGVRIDEFVVMPNHLHAILLIDACRGTMHRAPTETWEQFGKPVSSSVPTIVRSYKASVTRQINRSRQTPWLPVWQRNYYEHIIRSEDGLHLVRQYICENPLRWETDEENPINVATRFRGTVHRAPGLRCE